jgi:hypothetical protein
MREIATYQSIRNMLRRLSISTWIYYHERYLDAIYKRDGRLRHLYTMLMSYTAGVLRSYT